MMDCIVYIMSCDAIVKEWVEVETDSSPITVGSRGQDSGIVSARHPLL
jgi:hypothetical protein